RKQERLEDVSTVRILLLGDRGVGKSSLTDLLANSPVTPTPASRTVGESSWSVQVRLHEYPVPVAMPPSPLWTSSDSDRSRTHKHSRKKEPPPQQQEILYFVEFYDLNSELRMRRDHRYRFFRQIDGIILVHNLQDARSQDSLHDWLYEPLRQICKHRHRRPRPILRRQHVPILVVGTMIDRIDYEPVYHPGSIAHQLDAEEILLNCLDQESFAEKTCNQAKLSYFLNRVVEFKERFPL
ncbi:hypothetical protein KR067_012234, partial [Drosophila pandora]